MSEQVIRLCLLLFLSTLSSAGVVFPRADDATSTSTNFVPCDYGVSFHTLGDLQATISLSELGVAPFAASSVKGTMRSDCIAAYALDALITMLDTAYDNYTVVNKGYDKEFEYYVTYMKKTVSFTLDNSFMFDTSKATNTMNIAPPGPGMKYFDCKIDGHDKSFPCTEVVSLHNYEDMAYKKTALTLKDKDGYTAALSKAGINPDWVRFGDHEVDKDVVVPHASRKFQYQFSGYPVEKDNMAVPNPKDIVTKALPRIPDLRLEMKATLMDIMLGTWGNASVDGPAYAYSTPVFMLMQAVEGMAKAKALGEKEEEAEEEAKRNFIVTIISVVLLFVPIVGEEVAAAAGLASLARAIAIAGEVGNGALGIYDSVTNPSSAVINILGMLIGVGAVAKVSRDGPGLAEVARVQRSMDPSVAASFGPIFKKSVDELKGVMKFCKWS